VDAEDAPPAPGAQDTDVRVADDGAGEAGQ
jgi:hypothetical protein